MSIEKFSLMSLIYYNTDRVSNLIKGKNVNNIFQVKEEIHIGKIRMRSNVVGFMTKLSWKA